MKSTARNARIAQECQDKGEPFFVIRAKDKLAIQAVSDYIDQARNAECGDDLLMALSTLMGEMIDWRFTHRGEIKTPDLREDEIVTD